MCVRQGPRRLARLALAAAAAVLVATASVAEESGVAFLLREKLGFSAGDLESLDEGAAVINSLDTPIHEELGHVGAVFLDASSGQFVERFRDIVKFESGPGIPQIARFSTPPRLEDLASLTLPATDVSALQDCRPGHCDVKLSGEAMRRFRDEVDWSSPNAAIQANYVARTMILDLVRGYQADGNTALGYYDDGKNTLQVAEQFRALLDSSDLTPVPVPELITYLDDYPHGKLDGAEDIFYWTVVDFGLKLTIRVNHVVIYPLRESLVSGVTYAIAIKQLYASHYFHTTLELRFLVDDDRRAGRRGASLISVTRSRSDGMTGFKGLFLRPIIRIRSRDAVRKYLNHVKRQVEQPMPATH